MRSHPTSEKIVFRKVVRFRAENDLPGVIRDAARRRRMLPSEYLRQICQIGSTLTARSPQFEQRNRRSSSLNASMSAAPSSSSGPSSRAPHERQMARAQISKWSGELRSGRIVNRSAFQRSAWRQAHSAHRKSLRLFETRRVGTSTILLWLFAKVVPKASRS